VDEHAQMGLNATDVANATACTSQNRVVLHRLLLLLSDILPKYTDAIHLEASSNEAINQIPCPATARCHQKGTRLPRDAPAPTGGLAAVRRVLRGPCLRGRTGYAAVVSQASLQLRRCRIVTLVWTQHSMPRRQDRPYRHRVLQAPLQLRHCSCAVAE
jgi:hypothetical protein